jgi:8-oxo-dGTP pyrophosphatase MutT (NUDIX family)
MVPAGETLELALTREAWEEAGLRLDPSRLERGRSFRVRRPVPEGLQSEIIYAFDTSLPPGSHLQNRDGEVDAIEPRKVDDAVAAIERDEFTLESALATLESVARRGAFRTPTGLFSVA